jgi:hypothetical protein
MVAGQGDYMGRIPDFYKIILCAATWLLAMPGKDVAEFRVFSVGRELPLTTLRR